MPSVPDAVDYLVILGWIGIPDTRELEIFALAEPFALPPDRDKAVESEPAVPES